MKQRKARMYICQVCGMEFEVRTSKAKYCPSCRRKAYRKKARRREVHFICDTPEMMAMCLNCTRPSCGGECQKLADLVRRITAKGEENGTISDENL